MTGQELSLCVLTSVVQIITATRSEIVISLKISILKIPKKIPKTRYLLQIPTPTHYYL